MYTGSWGHKVGICELDEWLRIGTNGGLLWRR